MWLTSNKNYEIVNILIGGETFTVDRKILMKESHFFNGVLSSPAFINQDRAISFKDVDPTCFQIWLNYCNGEKCDINEDNVFKHCALSKCLESGIMVDDCLKFMASLSEEKQGVMSFKSLDDAIKRKDSGVQHVHKDLFRQVPVSCHFAKHKKIIKTLSPETQMYCFDILLEYTAFVDLETAKLDKKTSILESQLRKALEEIKESREVVKNMDDLRNKMTSSTKIMTSTEKKMKNQEEDLVNLRKYQETMNKQNQINRKQMKTSKLEFEEKLEKEKKLFEKQFADRLEAAKKSNKRKERNMQENMNKLEATILRLQDKIKTLQPEGITVGTSTDDLISVPITCSMETQTDNCEYYFDKSLASIWSDKPANSDFHFHDYNSVLTSGFEWKKRPVWKHCAFL